MERQDNLVKNSNKSKKLYHIITYGCQMNEHESEKIASLCEDLGFVKSDDKNAADLIVLNTCCVRENAENKIIGNIGALKILKKRNGNIKIAVVGCMTQQNAVAQKIYSTFPFVDIVLGTHNLHLLAAHLQESLSVGKRTLQVWNTEGEIVESNLPKKGGPTAYVNIMYGCDNYCAYCIVPYVRGSERSRDPKKILDEIEDLVRRGTKEVILLGQNVNSYGKDLGINFAALLKKICEKTEISRIRFMTSHPKDLSDELIGVMAKFPQICRHIHLPVQSGSTRILKKMNRKYSREDYLALIGKLRAAMPGVAVTTDIIVGFPGEREEDFGETLSLVKEVRFESAFTFIYSKRSGTAAAKMREQVLRADKKDRIVRLVALQNKITEEINKSYEGTIQKVLVEHLSTRSRRHVSGRAESGKTVNFPGDESMIGTFRNVRITQGKKTTLFGEIEDK